MLSGSGLFEGIYAKRFLTIDFATLGQWLRWRATSENRRGSLHAVFEVRQQELPPLLYSPWSGTEVWSVSWSSGDVECHMHLQPQTWERSTIYGAIPDAFYENSKNPSIAIPTDTCPVTSPAWFLKLFVVRKCKPTNATTIKSKSLNLCFDIIGTNGSSEKGI